MINESQAVTVTLVVQLMREFATQLPMKKMWPADAIARKMLATDDVIVAWKDFGI